MKYGLSDRDRELLERGRQDAAIKMAAERSRIDESERLAAAENERNARLGPLNCTGPDLVPVRLCVARSGFLDLDPTDPEGCLIAAPVVIVVMTAGWLTHKLIFRGGYTVHVQPQGRRSIKIRCRSEEAAADRLQEVATAVTRGGLAALRQLRT